MTRGKAPASFALGRLKRGEMNATEQAYATYLGEQVRAGTVLWWEFEGIKLKLGEGVFYTPDFAVMTAACELQMHETKGHWTDDARLKIKLAQDKFPFRFVALKVVPRSRGGGWEAEDFTKEAAPMLPGIRHKADVPPPVKREKKVSDANLNAKPRPRPVRRPIPSTTQPRIL